MKSPTINRRGFGTRRKIFVGLLALVVAYAGYAHYAGLAFMAGIPNSDMDWNGDGTVTATEIAQAWYAVTVKQTRDGRRECKQFHWRSSGQSIRVDCRTVMSP